MTDIPMTAQAFEHMFELAFTKGTLRVGHLRALRVLLREADSQPQEVRDAVLARARTVLRWRKRRPYQTDASITLFRDLVSKLEQPRLPATAEEHLALPGTKEVDSPADWARCVQDADGKVTTYVTKRPSTLLSEIHRV